ncbi:Uncharacterised protein [Mycobacteroides abscessus subsp. abscessus]|nr:Uncharacterised protein [Mycobacteroides abscessus subsp. abscessus]SIL27226.1 Uncharacterised protein [Mycobacteroides abscessus subsp. abscessus]
MGWRGPEQWGPRGVAHKISARSRRFSAGTTDIVIGTSRNQMRTARSCGISACKLYLLELGYGKSFEKLL